MIATLPNIGEQEVSEKYLTSKPHSDVVAINGNIFFDIDGVRISVRESDYKKLELKWQ